MSDENQSQSKSVEVNPPFSFIKDTWAGVTDFSPKPDYSPRNGDATTQVAGDNQNPKDSSAQASVEYVL